MSGDDTVILVNKAIISEAVQCLICLDDAVASRTYTCSHGHSVCEGCLRRYLNIRLEKPDFHTAPLACPGDCSDIMTEEDLLELNLGDLVPKVLELQRAFDNRDLVACPSCQCLTPASGRNYPEMKCPECKTSFCAFHGLSHGGRSCPAPKESHITQLRNYIWLIRNTRRCPGCGDRIQKNGGCEHMTCRCGHEICWRCGGSYVVADHGSPLLFRLFDLKSKCNGYTLWMIRLVILLAIILLVYVASPAWMLLLLISLPPFFWLKANRWLDTILQKKQANRKQSTEQYNAVLESR